MKLARQLERRLEQLVEGVAGRVFRGPLHPVELIARLLREADLAVFQTQSGPATANVFSVSAHPADLGGLDAGTLLSTELARVLDEEAALRGWRLAGPTEVRLTIDPELEPGAIAVNPSVAEGTLQPWAVLVGRSSLAIRPNRAIVGRSKTADVVISYPQVSRIHALLWREGNRALIEDLGSSNGTSVDGVVTDRAVEVEEGAVVSFGGAQFTFQRR